MGFAVPDDNKVLWLGTRYDIAVDDISITGANTKTITVAAGKYAVVWGYTFTQVENASGSVQFLSGSTALTGLMVAHTVPTTISMPPVQLAPGVLVPMFWTLVAGDDLKITTTGAGGGGHVIYSLDVTAIPS